MPDELPVTDGAQDEQQHTQQDVDWQKRYTDTHAEYNRLNETFRRFEADPSALIEFVEKHHPNLLTGDDDTSEQDDDSFDDDTDDPNALLAREVAELREWRQNQEAAQHQQTHRDEWAGWEEHVKAQAKQHGIDLSRRDINALKVDCTGQTSNGLQFPVAPEKANEVLNGYLEEYFKDDEPKQRPRAPHVPSNGKAQTGVPDWSKMTQTEIDKYMAERALALSQQ